VTFKSGLGSHKLIKNGTFESLGKVSYSPSIVTMAVSYIVSKIQRDIDRKSKFFIPLALDAPLGSSHRNIVMPFGVEKRNSVVTRWLEKFDDMFRQITGV